METPLVQYHPEPPEVPILLLGDPEVGKSTFLSRLSHGRNTTFAPLTEAPKLLRDLDQPFVYDVRMYNRPYRFEFSDNASPMNWSLLRPAVVVLCYDISSRRSLESIQERWAKEVIIHFTNHRDVPVLMMGLKRDLRVEDANTIYPQEAWRIAQELRCDAYMECSAMTGELCREAFEDIARKAAKTTTEKGGLTEMVCLVS